MEFPQLYDDVSQQCPGAKHDMVLVERARSVKQHSYRTSPRKLEYLRKEVQFLMNHGLVECSNSEWTSPCLLVDKSDG